MSDCFGVSEMNLFWLCNIVVLVRLCKFWGFFLILFNLVCVVFVIIYEVCFVLDSYGKEFRMYGNFNIWLNVLW